jgi:SAM-dependent methyltransferase
MLRATKELIKLHLPFVFIQMYRSIWRYIYLFLTVGSKLECPICNHTASRFISFGNPKRENAKCPNCGSLERHRLIWLYITEKGLLLEQNRIRILHFAPEECLFPKLSTISSINYSPCDLHPENYPKTYRKKISEINVCDIQYASNTFDAIICNHVLEHIKDDKKAMSEIFRVLKPGGWSILQVPIDYSQQITLEEISPLSPQEREKLFGQFDHVRLYGVDYLERLKNIGFEVYLEQYCLTLNTSLVKKFSLDKQETIFFCVKPTVK